MQNMHVVHVLRLQKVSLIKKMFLCMICQKSFFVKKLQKKSPVLCKRITEYKLNLLHTNISSIQRLRTLKCTEKNSFGAKDYNLQGVRTKNNDVHSLQFIFCALTSENIVPHLTAWIHWSVENKGDVLIRNTQRGIRKG